MGLIRNEVKKQRRHCRIRDLFIRAGRAVQVLKPCFLMSPLSVSQYIVPDAVEFDLVLIDEASQVKPEDALGTILRARQLVVVGDANQLPPTSFFDRVTDEVDDEEETQFDNAESILEVATKAFQPVRRLRWHYRSQHESLIQFSNHHFYDNDLIVFPSPSRDSGRLGVVYHQIEGGWFKKGENPEEAKRVVEAVITHLRRYPNESLGVGALNLKQSRLIEEILDAECQKHPDVMEAISRRQHLQEPIFIKNLENLQGDERDVICISCTYGPDPTTGRLMNRFGPINGPAGWRRLNVLVTRARQRLELFSSMQPHEINAGPEKPRGVIALRNYLEYALTGGSTGHQFVNEYELRTAFEHTVSRIVEKAGLVPVPRIGVAGFFLDMGVRNPNGNPDFLLGIQYDGPCYRSSKSTRDRDRLQDEVVLSRGWQLHRLWSLDWFMNQAYEEERLLSVLASLPKGDH
ncbi:MAG: hypothetical protein KatS3mg111_2385 [Pirellulaceae bacterium]|nr:MAG: hypothetical protein KatS3mg111_2385 [Pirellulaceae bacterium]